MNDEVLNEIENVAPIITDEAKKLFAEQDAELGINQPTPVDQGQEQQTTTNQSQQVSTETTQQQESTPKEEPKPKKEPKSELDAKVEAYREQIKTIPNAVSTTPMFKPTFLESFNETFGSSAGTIPQKAHTIAEIHNAMYPQDQIDAFEVIQRQRERVNLERLTEPAFLKNYRDLDSEEIKKYEQYKTANTNVRVNATSGKENINLIPFNQGDLFKEYAEANGSTFAEFAAAMEILPKLDLDFGVENPFEQLDDYEFLEYNKALFKYSGGTNKEALANTIRKDFK